ncbi:MAG TPA: hypothetical protein VL527_03665 [Dongiaceae bacterium]|nr:hypothetical protein [Dongiaceae bacterium]
MQFLRRNRFLLFVLAVLVFSDVMVLRQFIANESAHFERREDFILLHDMGKDVPAARLYQRLIQELPNLSEATLVSDFERTGMLVDSAKLGKDDLVWKYYVSVKNEMRQRSERRLVGALQEAAPQ